MPVEHPPSWSGRVRTLATMRRGFVLHHNGPPANCVGRPHHRCIDFWNNVGEYHAAKWGDAWIRSVYSFGICPHGEVFVGQGWLNRQAANGRDVVGPNDGGDSEWYTILCFVGGGAYGGFDTGSPEEAVTPMMDHAIRELIDRGRVNGHAQDRVLSHNQFKPKACPGPTLTALAHALDNNPTLSEDNMEFTRDEAFMYVSAQYHEIAGRAPEPGAAEAWADLVAGDARQQFRLISLLSQEARQRTAAKIQALIAGLADVNTKLEDIELDDATETEVRAIVAEGLQAALEAFGAAATT